MASTSRPVQGKVRAKDRIAQLEAELAELKVRLGAEPTTLESWGAHLPQEIRDQMAARALVQEWGDEPRALLRLGFECPKNATNRWMPEVWELAHKVFGTDGVQRILKSNLADLDAQKTMMLARLMQVATHGDDSNAVRAASQLAKIMGLNKADAASLQGGNMTVNLFQMMGKVDPDSPQRVSSVVEDVDAIIDATDFLVHEPGEAVKIDDSEDVRLHA